MNRPRNRQPRPQREQDTKQTSTNTGSSAQPNARGRGRGRGGRGRGNGRAPATQAQAMGTVPRTWQVIPGAAVYIVLKEDQPTGDETRGVVKDVLTRGDHPRGIKVRLMDGQVGRVQRMAPAGTASSGRFTHRYTDVREDEDEYPEGPPPRSLADFMPDEPLLDTRARGGEEEDGGREGGGAAVKCPFCDGFEGDEAAVTYHIDQEHLT